MGLIGLLVFTRIAADVVMLGALTLLLLSGAVALPQALAGFSNEGVITVGVLYVVVAGLRDTAAAGWLMTHVLGRPRTIGGAQLRMALPLAAASAIMNNTPLVAAMVPVVNDWARKIAVPVSMLMMPLSFATILGGLTTMIGTSTNLIAAGLSQSAVAAGAMQQGLSFFTLTPIAVPCAIAGIAYMVIAGRHLLPSRAAALPAAAGSRSYTVEMLVEPDSAICGRTIEAAGLRHLEGLFLAEVERDGTVIAAVPPTFRLQGLDRLVFVGAVESVVALQRHRGLRPATNQLFKLETPRFERVLIEAVVSPRCPIIGRSIRAGRFRTRYHAVVIAVGRSGRRMPGKIGEIVLRAGDQLLLETRPSFEREFRQSSDFHLVSELPDARVPHHERARVALAILAGMIVLGSAFEYAEVFVARGFSMLHAVLLAAMLMLATRCCSVESARRTIDWQVLIVIAAAIGIGNALTATGVAEAAAATLFDVGATNPYVMLALVYCLTMLFTEILSNGASVVLTFPVAIAAAATLDANPMPFVAAVTIAASCGFASPVGYQTNLIVYGPGGYRFTDYLRFGGPLNLIVGCVTVVLAPVCYPFYNA